MAYIVTALPDYTRDNADDLVYRSLFTARTGSIIENEGNVQTGIKSAENIEIFDTDAIFQTDGCGWSPTGNTAFTQRALTVGKVKIEEQLCQKTLEAKWTQMALKKGSDYSEDGIAFAETFSNMKADIIGEQLEIADWQGNTLSGNPNLNKYDGLIKLIDNSGVAVNGNPTNITAATGITAGNVKGIVNGMWVNLPARLKGKSDLRIFCGWDTFSLFVSAYTDANLFNFAPKGTEVSAENGEIIIPGTNYRLTAVHGLDGTNRLFAIRTSNMYLGVDLEHEEEEFKIWYSQDNDEHRFRAAFKRAINVAFPNEVVSFKLVP